MAIKKAIHPSLTEALQQGWRATSHYLGFYITLVLLIVLFNLIPSVVDSIFTDTGWFSPVLRGVFIILIALVSLGMVRTTLQSVDSKEPSLPELFKAHLFGRYLLTSILYLLVFVGGLVLFIAPGIYWGLRYQFATYLVAEDRYTVAEAFDESARMVEGHEWDLFAYWLVMFLLNLLGLLFFGIGVVITLPITLVGYSYIYKQLRAGRTHPPRKK